MPEVDRITEKGKKAIVALLNKSLQVEYGLILNYPRLLDQIVNIYEIHDEQLISDIEHLGKDSYQHSGWVGRLITELGGDPNWRVEVVDRIVDVEKLLVQQVQREKLARSLYLQAKRVAEQNHVKGVIDETAAIIAEFLGKTDLPRSNVIRILERLAQDELLHMRHAENAIEALKVLPKKRLLYDGS